MELARVLRDLGVDPRTVDGIRPIVRSEERRLYRLTVKGQRYVLKCFVEEGAPEPKAYELLCELRVPTLPLHARTPSALLLADLDASPRWRLAGDRDVESRDVGRAVAGWYQLLHVAGRSLVRQGAPDWLKWEWDALSAEGLLQVGKTLELEDNPVWRMAAYYLDALRNRVRQLPATLNYNDFHWTNLALSRRPPLKAIVFDYHLVGIGLAWSDLRNVISSLGPAAREAFLDAYGPTHPEERVLDEPLSVLHSLQVAAARPTLPRWAMPCVEKARSGSLLSSLERAVAIL